jgi:hypothetical protein
VSVVDDVGPVVGPVDGSVEAVVVGPVSVVDGFVVLPDAVPLVLSVPAEVLPVPSVSTLSSFVGVKQAEVAAHRGSKNQRMGDDRTLGGIGQENSKSVAGVLLGPGAAAPRDSRNGPEPSGGRVVGTRRRGDRRRAGLLEDST